MEEMGERSIIGAEVMDRGRKLSGYERVKVNTSEYKWISPRAREASGVARERQLQWRERRMLSLGTQNAPEMHSSFGA